MDFEYEIGQHWDNCYWCELYCYESADKFHVAYADAATPFGALLAAIVAGGPYKQEE